jgi:hypothetical protein
VYIPHVDKSARERELERRIDDEHDGRRRRELQRELDDLRDRRERENRRIDAERERAEDAKRDRIAERRLHGGSRFNIRYDDDVPAGIRPEEVMAALDQYVDFGAYGVDTRLASTTPAPVDPPALPAPLRKGMLRADVERALGAPAESSERRDGGVAVTRLVFASGDQRITAEFVEDVLVRYTIASR